MNHAASWIEASSEFSSPHAPPPRSLLLASPSTAPSPAPYLENVPQLPDHLALLASRKRLTADQEALLDGWIEKISRQIQKAREQWETEKADAQLSRS